MPPNPLLLGLSPAAYVLKAVRQTSARCILLACYPSADGKPSGRSLVMSSGTVPDLIQQPLTGPPLSQVMAVRAADLESALIMLPFTDALRLLTYLPLWLEQGAGAWAA